MERPRDEHWRQEGRATEAVPRRRRDVVGARRVGRDVRQPARRARCGRARGSARGGPDGVARAGAAIAGTATGTATGAFVRGTWRYRARGSADARPRGLRGAARTG